MKRVLIVTYHFPPSGGAKTRRTLKFLKYFSTFSWKAVVLTVKKGKIFNFDPSLMKDVPQDVKIYKSGSLSFLSRNHKDFDGICKGDKREARCNGLSLSIIRKYVKSLTKIVAIPDGFVGWIPAAVLYGKQIVERERIDVIYSTAPPFSNHLLAVLLKRLTGRPLVIDFRDAWVANPIREWRHQGIRQTIEAKFERLAIRYADFVVSTTVGITHDFCVRYPQEAVGKFVTVPNGYDCEEFALPARSQKRHHLKATKKFRIIHTGYLKMERSPKPFLHALQLLFQEFPHMRSNIEVYFIGENSYFLDGKTVWNYIEHYKLQDIVMVKGHIARAEAMRYQLDSDMLLLIIGVVPKEQVFTYGVASKLFDYMMAGKPVLALADDGPVSHLVKKSKIGESFEPKNIMGIKQYLLNSYTAYIQNTLSIQPDMEEIARYDVRRLTHELVELFETCTEGETVSLRSRLERTQKLD